MTSPHRSPSPTKEDVAAGKDILRRTSLRSKNRSLGGSRRSGSSEEQDQEDAPTRESQDVLMTVPETRPPEPVARPSKTRAVSGRLVNLARRPWTSSSPSRPDSPSSTKSSKSRVSHTEGQSSTSSDRGTGNDTDTQPLSRRRTILNKRPRRPMVAVVTHGRNDSVDTPNSPSTNSLRAKSSLEKLSASLNVSTPVLPPMPKGAAATAAALSGSGMDPPRKKDDLWGVFRGLEADYQK